MLLSNFKSVVSVNFLFNNLNNEKVVILDCTIPKVTGASKKVEEKNQIKGAVFFDIKKMFSETDSLFPNTILSPKEFEIKAQLLGINNDSIVICYDDLGIYSSPRVWWMFHLMGFKNIAVLDGGFPAWKNKQLPIEKPNDFKPQKGNFTVNYHPEKVKFTKDVLLSLKKNTVLIADARSKGRFLGIDPEPRKEIKSGHIPSSVSFPFAEILNNGMIKPVSELKSIYKNINPENKDFIFSCGSGITASILALGAEIAGYKNYAVYDGSWTEWGSTNGLPIEK